MNWMHDDHESIQWHWNGYLCYATAPRQMVCKQYRAVVNNPSACISNFPGRIAIFGTICVFSVFFGHDRVLLASDLGCVSMNTVCLAQSSIKLPMVRAAASPECCRTLVVHFCANLLSKPEATSKLIKHIHKRGMQSLVTCGNRLHGLGHKDKVGGQKWNGATWCCTLCTRWPRLEHEVLVPWSQ